MALYASRFWLCGPRARVVTVPVHAVCFNEDRRGRWWRVNYNLMLESNTISPFITPQCHGLTGSHQFVKGTHAEKAMLRSVLCGTEESELDEDFRCQINTVRFTKRTFQLLRGGMFPHKMNAGSCEKQSGKHAGHRSCRRICREIKASIWYRQTFISVFYFTYFYRCCLVICF